jgi:Flp pilus assembly protein TadG
MPKRRPRHDRGQALIEFALIVPLFLLFLFVIVDVGIALDRRMVLQHAVREGARYAALSIDNGLICDRTHDQAQGIVDVDDISISYDDIDGNGDVTDAGDAVNVTVDFTYDFPVMSGVLNAFGVLSPSVDINPTGSARLERQHPAEFNCPPP